jgi:hypothetical protein
LDVGVLREYIEIPAIIKLSRDANLPERIIRALQGYLNTLPGYIDAAFDDEGNERPPAPDQPMYDLQVARQQQRLSFDAVYSLRSNPLATNMAISLRRSSPILTFWTSCLIAESLSA